MTKKANDIRFPAEWERQSFVQLTFPHAETDWAYMLEEAVACFVNIAAEIVKRQDLLVVCHDVDEVKTALSALPQSRIRYAEVASNDTWARDHAPLTIIQSGQQRLLDFTFNGWGMKFPANLDNQINAQLSAQGFSPKGVKLMSRKEFIL